MNQKSRSGGKAGSPEAPAEYSIYVFVEKQRDSAAARWEKRDSVGTDMERALSEAASLFDTGDYRRVEVKKKALDPKTRRPADVTVRVFQKRSGKHRIPALIVGVAALCGLAAYGLTSCIGDNIKGSAPNVPETGAPQFELQ